RLRPAEANFEQRAGTDRLGCAERELVIASVDVAVAAATRRQRNGRLVECAELPVAVPSRERQGRVHLDVDLAAALVGVVREPLEQRVIVRGTRQVRRREAAQYFLCERRHRNRGAGWIHRPRAWISSIDGENALILQRSR